MSPSRRHIWIFALAGVTLVLNVATLLMVPMVGVAFAVGTTTPTAFVDRIESIPPQFTGATTRPDLRVGDELERLLADGAARTPEAAIALALDE